MKFKLKLIMFLVLIVSVVGATLYFSKGSFEKKITALEKGQEYETGNKIVPVYYGKEFEQIIKSKGDLIVHEQEDSREYIYDQSTWEWAPILSDKKKSIIVNKLTMNTKFLVDAKKLDIEIVENEEQIVFVIKLQKSDLVKDIQKDVTKSGIDWEKTEKGSWGEDLQAEITEQDEKNYRLELSEKEITDKQLYLAKQNLINSLKVLFEKTKIEKEITIE